MANKSKIALVTGGSRGLGKNMAEQLAQKGLDVIITYHSKKDEADKVVAAIEKNGQKAAALQLDAENTSSLSSFVNEVQSILQTKFQTTRFDYLINNAGIGAHANFAETTEVQFDSMVNIHLKTPYFLTQKLLPLQNDGGGIVNISSGLTRFSFTGYEAYATMKGAVETLTKYQAKFLGNRGIRANVVAPGAIETDFGGGAVRDNKEMNNMISSLTALGRVGLPDDIGGVVAFVVAPGAIETDFGGGAVRDNKEMNNMISSLTALGRVGLPDDIGGVVAFLCSDESKWVNGQRIEVSGGMNL